MPIINLRFSKTLLLAPFEANMAEALLVGVVSCLMEVVHVQLSHKWRKVVVLEVPRQDPFGEFVRLLHYETISCFAPTDYIVQLGILLINSDENGTSHWRYRRFLSGMRVRRRVPLRLNACFQIIVYGWSHLLHPWRHYSILTGSRVGFGWQKGRRKTLLVKLLGCWHWSCWPLAALGETWFSTS